MLLVHCGVWSNQAEWRAESLWSWAAVFIWRVGVVSLRYGTTCFSHLQLILRKTRVEAVWAWNYRHPEVSNYRASTCVLCHWQLWECKAEDDVSRFLLAYRFVIFLYLVTLLPQFQDHLACAMIPTPRPYNCWILNVKSRSWSQTSTVKLELLLMLSTSFNLIKIRKSVNPKE